MEITIDLEFSKLIPPLTEAEFGGLEASILKDGCRDPLIVWKERSILLDGHNRHSICTAHNISYDIKELSFQDITEARNWVINNQFSRRNLSLYQRAELASQLKNVFQKQGKRNMSQGCQNSDNLDTKKELAKIAGVSHDTMHKAAILSQKADDALKGKLRTGEVSIHQAYQKVRQQTKQLNKAKRQSIQDAATISPADTLLYNCSVDQLKQYVMPCSLDHIVTDPPYSCSELEVYSDLARFAEYSLMPGGSCIVMCGLSCLPQIINRLLEYLTYHWTGCYLVPGGQSAQLFQRKVNTFWKPLLIFTKGEYAGNWVGDVCKSEKNDKNHHRWGQSESGMIEILSRWTKPGDLVCDPFVGGGTTAIAAMQLKRKFVGCDIDEESVKKAKQRVAEIYISKEGN